MQSDDFRLLLNLASVGEIAVQLGRSVYASVLRGFDLGEMRRTELEFLLGTSSLTEGMAFMHYADLGDKKLLDIWLENFDIMLLKNHIRLTVGSGRWSENEEHLDARRILDLVSDFHFSLIDEEKLLSAGTLKDILLSVRKESLRTALTEAVSSRDSEVSYKMIFNASMMLDRYYYDNLYAAVSALGGVEGRVTQMLVGTRVDLINLYWIYRARRFFSMSPEAALTLITKARYRADFELLAAAAFAEPGALAAALAATPYASVFASDNASPSLREVEIENNIRRFLFAVAERVFLSGSLGFQNVAAYLTLKELEIGDLVAIIESVRYGFDRSKASLLFARPLGKEI